MKELEKIIRCKDVSLENKVKLIRTSVFLIIMYGFKTWTVKKTNRKNIDSFEI